MGVARGRRIGSVAGRLVLAFAGVSVFTLMAVGVVFYVFLGDYVLERNREQLLEQAVEVAEQIEALVEMAPNAFARPGMLNILIRSDLRVLPRGAGIVVFRDSEVVARAGSVPVRDRGLSRLRERGERVGAHGPGSEVIRLAGDLTGREADVLVAAAPIRPANGPQGLAVVTLTAADAVAARSGLVQALLVSGGIAGVLAVTLGLGLGSWMSRPLRRLSSAARGMAEGVYDRPVDGTYSGELRELAQSLEMMRQEVRRSQESLQAFVGSAAHELRTPLTSIEGFSQALLDGTASTHDDRQRSAAAVYRESVRLRRLVDTLLTLSRYDSREFHANNEMVAVRSLVAEEVDRLVQTGLASKDRITVHIGAEVALVTDREMLRRVIANLLKNAVQYGADEPVLVSAREEGLSVVLEFSNGGPGLAPEERTKVFARFFRGRGSMGREGFGLGLPLAKEICTLLGGSVELLEDTGGTVFRVTLPRNPRPQKPPASGL